MSYSRLQIVRATAFTIFVFGFSGWFYIAQNAVFHPQTLQLQLSHLLPWPHEDTFGAVCYALSFIALFTYMLVRDRPDKLKR